jgi:hypothetical protein
MKPKVISMEVIPNPKNPIGYRLTIVWITSDNLLLADESSHLHIQGVEEKIRDFRISNDL